MKEGWPYLLLLNVLRILIIGCFLFVESGLASPLPDLDLHNLPNHYLEGLD